MFSRIVLAVSSLAHLLMAVLMTVGAMFGAAGAPGGGIAGIPFSVAGFAGAIVAARGSVRMGERVAGIVINAVLAACLGGAAGVGAAVVAGGGPTGGGLPGFVAVLGLTLLTLPAIGGIVGFARLPKTPPRVAGQRAPARTGVWITGVMAGLVMIGTTLLGVGTTVWPFVRAAASGGSGPGLATALTGTPQRFETLNFQWTAPGRPWVTVNAATFNPDATLVARRVRPEIVHMIIAEEMGESDDFTSEGLAELSMANLRSASSSLRIQSRTPHRVAGIEGILIRSDAVVTRQRIRYVHWVGVHNGFWYQLVTGGASSDQSRIESEAHRMLGRFALIDPARVAAGDVGTSVEHARSETYGYEADLGGRGWIDWETIEADLPEAEFGVLRHDGGAFAVIAVRLDGVTPDDDASARALLSMMNLVFPGPEISNVRPIERDGVRGYEMDASRTIDDGTRYDYRLQALRNDRFAYLVGGWWVESVPAAEAAVERALDSVRFFEAAPWTEATTASLDARQRERHLLYLNQLGLDRYERGQYRQSVEYFRRALAFNPDDAAVFQNVIDGLAEMGRYAEAVDEIERTGDRFSAVEGVVVRLARYRVDSGDATGAIETYQVLFDGGYRDDQLMLEYVDLLIAAGWVDDARSVLDTRAIAPDGVPARIARANVLAASDRLDDAFALLQEDLDRVPFEAEIADHLASLAYEHDAYNEAILACDVMIERGAAGARTWYMKAISEAGLTWYRRAKASLEQAAVLAPANETVREELQYVTSLLGEGENSSIRRPIDAVAWPESLSEGEPADAWLDAARKAAGCCYERRVTAITFRPGATCRTTEHVRARVLDQRGLDDLSALQYDFDPLHERIFVNDLTVYDETGEPVYRGTADDWYVLDEQNASIASFDQTLHVPVAGLQPGYVLEATVTRERLAAPDSLPLVDHVFSSGLPVHRSALWLDTGEAECTWQGPAPATGDAGTLWVVENPVPWRWEPRQPNYLTFVPCVRIVGTGSSWEASGRGYLDDIAARLEVTSALRSLAASITDGIETVEERVAALAAYVQGGYSYRAIAFGPRAWMPTEPAVIVRNRFGDCKDHALLLHLLLEASEIESNLALVSVSTPVADELPSLDQFDHMIVHVPALADDRFLDATDKGTDVMAAVPLYLAGRRTLVLESAGGRLVSIPAYPEDSGGWRIERTVRPEAGGAAIVESTVAIDGHAAMWFRQALGASAESEHLSIVYEYLARSGLPIRMHSVTAEHLDDPAKPLVLHLSFEVRDAVLVVNDHAVFRLPAVWELAAIEEQATADRLTPFELHFPLALVSRTRLVVPEGVRVEDGVIAGLNGGEQSDFWSFRSTASTEPGAVIVDFRANRSRGVFPSDRYGDLLRACEATLAPLETRIVFIGEWGDSP